MFHQAIDSKFLTLLEYAFTTFFLVPKPNLDSYVFLRANERQEQILIEPELEDEQK